MPMTVIGVGGICFDKLAYTKRFKKELKKLERQLREQVYEKVKDLLKNPRPPGLGFEKLKGYDTPDIFTIHVDGNYKISLHVLTSIEADKKINIAVLRRVGTHNEIDRRP